MKTHWFFRLPIIRHIRYLYWYRQMHRWARNWAKIGVGTGIPNDADLEALDKIWKGEW